MNLHIEAQFIRNEVQRILSAYPELGADDELCVDMLEGETDVMDFLARALAQRQEAATMHEAIKARIAELSGRADRYSRKAEAMKLLMLTIMREAALRKLELPEATLSVSKPRTSVNVHDLDALPQGYFRLKKDADKEAIRRAFEAGEPVPGATLVKGEPSLTVRTR